MKCYFLSTSHCQSAAERISHLRDIFFPPVRAILRAIQSDLLVYIECHQSSHKPVETHPGLAHAAGDDIIFYTRIYIDSVRQKYHSVQPMRLTRSYQLH